MTRSSSNNAAQAAKEDLTLLAMLVAKMLRDDGIAAPPSGDYRIGESRRRPDGRPVLNVPINLGRGLSVAIHQDWGDNNRTQAGMSLSAAEIADAIRMAHSSAADLRAMRSEVATVAKREIAEANRRGLNYRFMSASPTPILAGETSDVSIKLSYQALDKDLRHRLIDVDVEGADDVKDIFNSQQQSQTDRAQARDAFATNGASGAIDAVVLGAIRAAGISDAHLMSRLAEEDDWIVDLRDENGLRFRLYWDAGKVLSSMPISADLKWSAGWLHFGCAPRAIDPSLDGRPASSVFPHELLSDDVRIVGSYGEKGDSGWLLCTQPMVEFNLKTGRLAA